MEQNPGLPGKAPSTPPERVPLESPNLNGSQSPPNENSDPTFSEVAAASLNNQNIATESPEVASSASGDSDNHHSQQTSFKASFFVPYTAPSPLETELGSEWIGEVIKVSKKAQQGRKGSWALVHCPVAGRTFIFFGSTKRIRSGLHVWFTSSGYSSELGGEWYTTIDDIKALTYDQAKVTNNSGTWTQGILHPGQGKFTVKRDLTMHGGSSIDITVSKDFYHVSNNSYIKRGSPIIYTTYSTDNGDLGICVHAYDMLTLRQRSTNQISPEFMRQLMTAYPGSFLLGGLNCTNVEPICVNQTGLFKLLLDCPDFSRIQLGKTIDAMRTSCNIPQDAPTPQIFILSEGRTVAEWHTAINRFLDSPSLVHKRDKDLRISLLLQTPQATTTATVHSFLPLGMMNDQHLASNHAKSLLLVEGGVPVGIRPGRLAFQPEFVDGKIAILTYGAPKVNIGPDKSHCGTLHATAQAITKIQLLSNFTAPAPVEISLPAELDQQTLQHNGMIITYPKGQRKNVDNSVNHLTNVTTIRSSFYVPSYKQEGALYSGPLPWGTIATELNRNTTNCAMSLADFVSKDTWTLHLGEGNSVSHLILRKLFKKGTFAQADSRDWRVHPGVDEATFIETITNYNSSQTAVRRNKKSSPNNITFLNASRGDTVHWFGAPKKASYRAHTSTPDFNDEGFQGFVLAGALPSVPGGKAALSTVMDAMGIDQVQARKSRWFHTHRQEWAILLYAPATCAAAKPVSLNGTIYSLIPLHFWTQKKWVQDYVFAPSKSDVSVEAICSRSAGARANLAPEPEITEELKKDLELATGASAKAAAKAKTKQREAAIAAKEKQQREESRLASARSAQTAHVQASKPDDQGAVDLLEDSDTWMMYFDDQMSFKAAQLEATKKDAAAAAASPPSTSSDKSKARGKTARKPSKMLDCTSPNRAGRTILQPHMLSVAPLSSSAGCYNTSSSSSVSAGPGTPATPGGSGRGLAGGAGAISVVVEEEATGSLDDMTAGLGGPAWKKRKGAGRPTLGARAIQGSIADPSQLRLNFSAVPTVPTPAGLSTTPANAGVGVGLSSDDKMVEDTDL